MKNILNNGVLVLKMEKANHKKELKRKKNENKFQFRPRQDSNL